jgi:hypothetical protein
MAICAPGDVVYELFADPLSVPPRRIGATDFKRNAAGADTYQHLRLVA